MRINRIRMGMRAFPGKYRYAVVSDLHGADPKEALEALRKVRPNVILVPGDIVEPSDGLHERAIQTGVDFLRKAARLAPTLVSIGNHENGGTGSWKPKWWFGREQPSLFSEETRQRIIESGAVLLDNTFCELDGVRYAGVSSALIRNGGKPDLSFMKDFLDTDMPCVLLCHHPEYYKRYFKDTGISLMVSGHAHGGQWRIGSRGVFAPGQGLFPAYTRGLYDGRLVVSTGVVPGKPIPRFFNPPEIVSIEINEA